MVLQGLENNYYLAGNDIWLHLYSISSPALKLELTCTNLTTSETLKKLTLYPSPDNEFRFNISEPVRALFPEPNHIVNNNLQQISFAFKVSYVDTNITASEFSEVKYFVRGFRKKQGTKDWFLQPSEELVIKPWSQWIGVTFPGYAQRLQSSLITSYVPGQIKVNRLNDCSYKIIKFLNSLGGYQFYVFENWKIKPKAKSKGYVQRVQHRLRENNFKSLGSEISEVIEFQAKTPYEMQGIINDLVMSSEVYLYDPEGDDDNSKWIMLDYDSNSAEENNQDLSYDNKLSYNIINNVNVWL